MGNQAQLLGSPMLGREHLRPEPGVFERRVVASVLISWHELSQRPRPSQEAAYASCSQAVMALLPTITQHAQFSPLWKGIEKNVKGRSEVGKSIYTQPLVSIADMGWIYFRIK